MDEIKLNELFREILMNKDCVQPHSSISTSDISTFNSSIGIETAITYEDVLENLQGIFNTITQMDEIVENFVPIMPNNNKLSAS